MSKLVLYWSLSNRRTYEFTDSKKKSDCKKKKKKYQKKKYEKDYFREVCSNTYLNVGLPNVNSNPECKLLDEPEKLMKDSGSKIIKCEQDIVRKDQ